jgi:hypothetical protein
MAQGANGIKMADQAADANQPLARRRCRKFC